MDFLGIVRDIGVRVETVFGEPFLVTFHLVLGDCLFVEIFIRKLSEPVTARLMAKNLPEIFGVVVGNRDVGYSPRRPTTCRLYRHISRNSGSPVQACFSP